ncbi:hypothetical protein CKO09_06020 [Chromatium weissei]|nr:hypothetical protein [Chromatium weissei]
MKKRLTVLLLTAVGLIATLPAQADRIRDRIEHQRMMMERGLETGALTRHEVQELRREQRKLRQMAESLRDSGASRMEQRQVLDTRLDRIDRRIKKAMRDDDRQRDDRWPSDMNERNSDRFDNRDDITRQPWER